MKSTNLLLFTTILLLAISCKKETINSESSSSLIKNPISFLKNIIGTDDSKNAIKEDENGKYNFNLILEKDSIYKINTKVLNNQTIDMQGQKSTTTESQQTNMDLKVKEVTKEGYKIEVIIKSIVMKQKTQGKEIVVDTNTQLPATKEIQMVWRMQKAITNQPFYVDLTNKAKVKTIIGLEELYVNVENKLKNEFKPEELNAVMLNIKQSLNKELLKNQFESGLNKFPKNSIKIGETWVEENNIPERNVINKITYKLEAVENNEVIISMIGKINQNSEQTDPNAGMKQSLNMLNNSEGKIIYNVKSGWLKNSIVNEKITAKQSLTQLSSNQTQAMEMIAKRTSSIN
ncbi:MAG: DUF6263 family protein [Solirubrobacteraceae bacterium]